jgi:hypothetical protein
MSKTVILLLCSLCVGQAVRTPSAREHTAIKPLRETELDLAGLRLSSDVPVDPDGKQGPRRTAGYYSLKHTQVCELLGSFQ